MNKSKILGQYQSLNNKKFLIQKQQDEQQNKMFHTLANNLQKSYIAQKHKGKIQPITAKDIKQTKKNTIFGEKQAIVEDLTISQIKGSNIVIVQDISRGKNQTCFCGIGQNFNIQCYFLLEEPSRLVLINKITQKMQYTINFDTVDVQTHQNFDISLVIGKLTLRLSHPSFEILKSHFNQLKKLIKSSYGHQLKMLDLAQKHPQTFYKHLYCTQDQFSTNCDTGDILLFQDQHFFAKAQRFILNADYDHVAMIIRDKKYGILMFQANSMSGVALTPWSCMVKYGWYKLINRVVWRKLENVQRSKFFARVIHQFVKTNLKTNYYISVDKLLSNQSYIGKKQQEKGFFCSQLIATIYKDLGIMTRNKQSKNYIAASKVYPYHFSEKTDLKLEMGNLSKQYEIHFHQQILRKQYGQKFIKK